MLLCRIIRSLILQRSESDYCCCCFRSYPFVFENFNLKVRRITSQRWRSTILSIDECRLFSVNLVQCIIIQEPQYRPRTVGVFYCHRIRWETFGRIMTLCCQAERGRKSGSDLVWFGLMLNVPVNNFSVMLGRSHRFLCTTSIYFFFGEGGDMSCSRTQHGDSSGV